MLDADGQAEVVLNEIIEITKDNASLSTIGRWFDLSGASFARARDLAKQVVDALEAVGHARVLQVLVVVAHELHQRQQQTRARRGLLLIAAATSPPAHMLPRRVPRASTP